MGEVAADDLFVTLCRGVPAPGSADPAETEAMTPRTRRSMESQHLCCHIFCRGAPLRGFGGQPFGDLERHGNPQLGHGLNGTSGLNVRLPISPDGEVQVVCGALGSGRSSRMSAPTVSLPAVSLPAGWVAACTARSLAMETRYGAVGYSNCRNTRPQRS